MLRCLVYTRTSHKLRFPDPSPPRPPAAAGNKKKKKNRFPKMVTRVGFLENADLSFSNTMMSYIIQRMPCEMLSYFHLFSVLAWTGESYSGQTKSHLVKQATCGLVFL